MKITKKLIHEYVFTDNFSASANGLTPDEVNVMYKAVEGIEHSNILWEKIKKSHKMHYSNADKKVFVNMVYENINA